MFPANSNRGNAVRAQPQRPPDMTAMPEPGATVETASGTIRGTRNGAAFVFKGIPYGASTAGANRFRAPAAAVPWTGVKETIGYAASAPQPARATIDAFAWYFTAIPWSEDCLYLNVFTPATQGAAKRPVMVWFHGGGFTTGAGTAKGFEGSNLAIGGDVVVVTVNHRLNIFGHFLPDGGGAAFADGGNASELDLIAALAWVRDNIHRFGGDAENVTIFGQSGGASKVAVLMAMPAAHGLFHRAIVESASSLLRAAEPEDTARAAHAVLKHLDITAPAALRDVPAAKLLEAMAGAIQASGGIDNFRPVRDGIHLPTHPFAPEAPALSAKIPLLIGTARDEATFYLAADRANFAMPRARAVARAGRFLGLDDAAAGQLFAAYETTHAGATPSEVYIAIHADHMYRRNDIRAAELRAHQHGADTFMYLFTWKTPVMDGILGATHTLEVPFVFGNTDLVPEIVGAGPERLAMQRRIMGAWTEFARTGRPENADLPAWTPYSLPQRATMILDNGCAMVSDPAREDRLAIEACPPYAPAETGRR